METVPRYPSSTAAPCNEAKLQRLNRLYAFSSAINAAIVRLSDRAELYEQACRIAVEQGGLVMAWVGLVEPGTEMIVPVARWGRDEGYLDSIRLSINPDQMEGRGPAGQAYRTQQPAWCNDVALATSTFAWRGPAGARGYASCAAFPLTSGGRSIGVMGVYGGEEQYFDTEELQVLNSLAKNISFALEALTGEEQRVRTEKALRLSEERFSLLSKATNDAIWDWNLATNQTWWNGGLRTLFGYEASEVGPNFAWWAEHIHPEDRERALQSIRQAQEQASTWSAGYRFQRKDGTYVHVLDRGHVIRNAEGHRVRMVGSLTDLSEQRRAEARIAEQAALLDQARDAILVRGLDHTIRYCNKSAERLYGWTAGEMLGHSVRELLLYQDPAVFDEASRKVIEEGEWVGQLTQVSKDGHELTVETRWTLVRDEAGAPKAVFAINTDITERIALERQFYRAQRMESIGTLAGGIAHDLNNALSPVIMSLDLLKLRFTDPDSQELLELIMASAERGADMVRQVLSFARGVEGLRVDVDIRNLVRELEKIANETFLKHIEVRTAVADEIWYVAGDPTQLHQVMLNLCVNARDAMPDGGILTLCADNQVIAASGTPAHAGIPPGAYVLLRVQDTGGGIAPELMEKLFDPFFTTKAFGQGTGLGLSTSLAIVKSHGGFIRVSSQPGRGSAFRVYFPAKAPDSATASERVDASMPRGHGECILVVDDESLVREITKRTLESYGYQVLLAAHGAEALEIFSRDRAKIAVVVTDMMMPVMDGPTAIQRLLEIEPNLRIIAVSGLSTSSQVAKLPALGVHYFLPKPYTAHALVTKLHQALSDI